jgi:hypothetical protein
MNLENLHVTIETFPERHYISISKVIRELCTTKKYSLTENWILDRSEPLGYSYYWRISGMFGDELEVEKLTDNLKRMGIKIYSLAIVPAHTCTPWFKTCLTATSPSTLANIILKP